MVKTNNDLFPMVCINPLSPNVFSRAKYFFNLIATDRQTFIHSFRRRRRERKKGVHMHNVIEETGLPLTKMSKI